ncbi:hypothetical protein F0562_022190 [Nyssa sinensis]|uniref:F-box domain-containing protein n=1 Tax=Nyssa sinensis TaxID=561372 RepID=A0A5J5BNG6_9ASTE|nr:hypothetical protein F0562_022190 [Nyssa sinensis]
MTTVSDLPISILMCILSRLSVKDLYSCRRVCKSWLALVSDPYFAKLHHSVAPTGILVPNLLLRHMRFIEFFESSSSSEHNRNILKFKTSSNFYSDPSSLKNLKHTNSCNGLLCFYEFGECFYICNPIINEYVRIPQAISGSFVLIDFGFGFSSVNNQYKVIRYLCPGNLLDYSLLQVEIYTLGEDSRRSLGIGIVPPSFSNIYRQKGPFLTGALHYLLATTDGFFESICCFDFVNESFRFVPSPSHFGDDHKYPITQMRFSVLSNCLCIGLYLYSEPEPRFDVWMMADYGVKGSWTKVITITEGIDIHIPYHPLRLFDNGEIFMSVQGPKGKTVLVSFDPTTTIFNLVQTCKRKRDFFYSFCGPIPFVPSLVSLKEVVGEQHFKNLERGRRMTIRENGLGRRVSEEEAKLKKAIQHVV